MEYHEQIDDPGYFPLAWMYYNCYGTVIKSDLPVSNGKQINKKQNKKRVICTQNASPTFQR